MSRALSADHLESSLLDTVQFFNVPFQLGLLKLDTIPGADTQVLSRGRCCPPLICWCCPSWCCPGHSLPCLQLEHSDELHSAGASNDPISLLSIVTHPSVSYLLLLGGFTSLLVQNFVLLLGELQEVLLTNSQVSQGVLGWKLCYLSIYILFMYSCNTITTSQIPDHFLH